MTGIPVHLLTIVAIISSSTLFFKSVPVSTIFSQRALRSSSCLTNSGNLPYSISAALLNSLFFFAVSASLRRASAFVLMDAMSLKTLFSVSNCTSRECIFSFASPSSFSIAFRRSSFFLFFSIKSASFSTISVLIARLMRLSSVGSLSICILSSAAASSIRSIALSGKKRSLM